MPGMFSKCKLYFIITLMPYLEFVVDFIQYDWLYISAAFSII
jgi:hypothetical protein